MYSYCFSTPNLFDLYSKGAWVLPFEEEEEQQQQEEEEQQEQQQQQEQQEQQQARSAVQTILSRGTIDSTEDS
jgi:hypothetical protein